MDVKQAIRERRSYRAIKDFEVTEGLVNDLAEAASLAPSCYNNQPWRYLFVYESEKLEALYSALADANSWAKDGGMLIAVFGKKEDDCVVNQREYYSFDIGLATSNLMLRATELGLVTHAMAGYDEQEAKEILGISDDMELITLIAVGKHDKDSAKAKKEAERPERLPLSEIAYKNSLD